MTKDEIIDCTSADCICADQDPGELCPFCDKTKFLSTMFPEKEDFRVKMHQYWMFPNASASEDLGGVWETTGIRDYNTEDERWSIQRVMVTGENQEYGKILEFYLPKQVFLLIGNCVELKTIYNAAEVRKSKANKT